MDFTKKKKKREKKAAELTEEAALMLWRLKKGKWGLPAVLLKWEMRSRLGKIYTSTK